jgi:ankyrin repeat protein
LGAAADAGHLNVVQYLVSKGANVNAKDRNGYTPLLLALVSDNADIELLKVLVGEGADVNVKAASDGFTALHWAAANNRVDAISFLLDKGANKNARNGNNVTPLFLAASKGNLDVVDDLINNRGVHLNDNIFSAAKNGYIGLIKYFVERRAVEPFAKNQNGDTPLHEAVSYGHTNVVKYFLDEKSGNVNLPNRRGETPLLVAARNGQLNVIRYLLNEANANITARDNDQNSVLHKAAESGSLALVKYLVEEKNVDTYVKNKFEQNPLDVAKANGRNDIIRYFVNVKGMPDPTISKAPESDRHHSQPTDAVPKPQNSAKQYFTLPQSGGNGLIWTTIEESDNNGRPRYKYTVKETPSNPDVQTFVPIGNKPTQFIPKRPNSYFSNDNTEFYEYHAWSTGPDGRVYETFSNTGSVNSNFPTPGRVHPGGQGTGLLNPGSFIPGISGPNGGGGGGRINFDFTGSGPTISSGPVGPSGGSWQTYSFNTIGNRKRHVSGVDRTGQMITPAPFFLPGNLPSIPDGRVNEFGSQPKSVDGLLSLLDVSARRITGNRYKSPKHESLLTPTEILERKFDHNAITAVDSVDDFE